MRSSDEARTALHRLFQRKPIAELRDLFAVIKTRSRMTIFRRLSTVGYLSSYSHRGRYYTLTDVPEFDREGLWQHEGVGFSRDGTLKATVARLVDDAAAGLFHRELQARLLVRVHNTLANLIEERRIGREHIQDENDYLYVSIAPKRATIQVRQRREMEETAKKAVTISADIDPSLVIEVLLEVIRGAVVRVDTRRGVSRLAARGIAVTALQVEEIFRRQGVEKKTASSRWRRSPR